MTYDDLKAALDAYFSDKSRSREETREGLKDIISDARVLIECLDEDDRNDT